MSIGMKTIRVMLTGLSPVMFDRYPGNNNDQLPWQKKCYTNNCNTGNELVLPTINLLSFLTAQNTESAPQRVIGKRWKAVAKACQSYVSIGGMEIPFLRDGKKITPDALRKECHVARVMKGKLCIPSPKERPVLDAPWSLTFDLAIMDNPDVSADVLRKLFEVGGIAIGLGTFRGVYGKFKVSQWEEI